MRVRGGVALAVAGLVLLVPLAVAYACIPLATLNVTPAQAGPGQEVTVTGTATDGSGSPAGAPVEVHLDTADGPVLASIVPDPAGRLDGSFTFPTGVNPGDHVLVAVRPGRPADPARAVLRVLPVAVGDPGAEVPRRPIDPVPLVFPALGALGLALLAGGVCSIAGGRRPAPVAVRAVFGR